MQAETTATAEQVEQAESEYQRHGDVLAAKLEAEKDARQREYEIVEVSCTLRDQLKATEHAFTTADAEALQATIYAHAEAAEKRRAAEALGRDATFLRRALEYCNVFPLEDARLAVLDAEANSAEARYEYEKARSAAHDARLFAIVAQASEFNGGNSKFKTAGSRPAFANS